MTKEGNQNSGVDKFILGTKEEMTQIFHKDGSVSPVTVISIKPLVVTQVKTKETDGYTSVQVGYGTRNEKNINKAQKKKGAFEKIKEFRVADPSVYKIGDAVKTDVFADGMIVRVSGISKGKGFQGVVKRHGFGGGRRSHGQKHSEREPGSIGGGGRAGGRVAKGMRMAGRMGGERVSFKNLQIVKVDAEENKIYIKGAVPGRRGTLIEIRG